MRLCILILFAYVSLKSIVKGMELSKSTVLQCDENTELGFDLSVWAPNAHNITVMVASSKIRHLTEDDFMPIANLSKLSMHDDIWQSSICLPLKSAFFYRIVHDNDTYARIDPYCRQMNGSPPFFQSCQVVRIQVFFTWYIHMNVQ